METVGTIAYSSAPTDDRRNVDLAFRASLMTKTTLFLPPRTPRKTIGSLIFGM
jgi:hypothetical protein